MASKGSKSRDHHWWPVGLQSYWSDPEGYLSWIEPNGKIDKKKSANRKIGFKAHGHTLFRGEPWWESNFEDEFDIDNEVHKLVSIVRDLSPGGVRRSKFSSAIQSLRQQDRDLSKFVKVHHIEERSSRELLLFLMSLVIRSPSYRWTYENFPARFGLPINENIGKANMRQSYLLAKKLCQQGVMTNRAFVVLHSDHERFISGDGYLDLMTGSLQASRIDGRIVVPLTPNICIYVCTPMAMRTDRNCYAVRVPPWVVKQINQITQVYSRDRLFYLGKPPALTAEFEKRQFLQYTSPSIDILEALDAIAQPKSEWMMLP